MELRQPPQTPRAVVRGHSYDQARGPGGPQAGPRRISKGPRKGPRNEAAQEKAVKGKLDAVCFLEKIRKKNQSKGVLRVVGGSGSL
jgi:hypothetical protein